MWKVWSLIKRLSPTVVASIVLGGVALAWVAIGTHTGAWPSFDAVAWNQYTQATLPTTVSNPFLTNAASDGSEITCSDCTPVEPPAGGVSRGAKTIACKWDYTKQEWDCTQHGNILYVTDFGALCDGVTDDNAALNLAITTADANPTTGPNYKLHFPQGKCLSSQPLDFRSLTVEGEGAGILGGAPHFGTELSYTGTQFPGASDCAFNGLSHAYEMRFHGSWTLGSGAGKMSGVCPATTSRTRQLAHAADIAPVYRDITVDGFSAACVDISTPITGTSVNGGGLYNSWIDTCPYNLRAFGGKQYTTTLSGATTLPSATINVADTSQFGIGRGTFIILVGDGQEANPVVCTGITPTSFTGCSGGSGTWPSGGIVQENGNIVGFGIEGNQMLEAGIGVLAGPPNVLSEYGEAFLYITDNHIQNGDTHSGDVTDLWNIETGGQSNYIAGNYLSGGPSVGSGQTWHAPIDTTYNGANTTNGGNIVGGNNCTTNGTPLTQGMKTLITDIVLANNRGCGVKPTHGEPGGDVISSRFGATLAPNDITLYGGNPGSGDYSIALVGITQAGSKATYSPWITIHDAPASFDSNNFVRTCWGPAPQFSHVDVLISGAASPPAIPISSIATNVLWAGNDGFDCFSDVHGPSSASAYTVVSDQTGRGEFDSIADETLKIVNGGHFSSLLGTGTAPTPSTGSVTAASDDTAGVVTGCTSPCTVTFGTPYHAAPVCIAIDRTSATAPIVSGETTAVFVVTTTGTDSFAYACVGK